MQERWDLVEAYPPQFRSMVNLFTTYTDSAFPTDAPTDKGLRVALRYEVGRFFASLERLRQATSRKALDEAYLAYADMSWHFDRYLRVGGLYTYYDDSISNEPYFKGIADSALVYADPRRDPPAVRDLVIIIRGPDKGKTGIVIGINPDASRSENMYVKLDRYKGLREIRVMPNLWVAKRLGEQDPDDVFLIPRKA
jgi:KOW motif